jgi:hypothetical protein
MKTQHTPTPWKVGMVRPELIISGEYPKNPAIAEALLHDWDTSNPWITHEMQKANAAHIVHCVNSYDELLAALEAFVNAEKSFRANSNPADYPPKEGDDMTAAYDLAVATLAKCERAAQ